MDRAPYYVYIMTNARNGTLYVGVTNDILRRAWEHRHDLNAGFTRKYGLHRLVWCELHEDIAQAIAREKQIKGWNRAWKIALIEQTNSDWNDLADRMRGRSAQPQVPFVR